MLADPDEAAEALAERAGCQVVGWTVDALDPRDDTYRPMVALRVAADRGHLLSRLADRPIRLAGAEGPAGPGDPRASAQSPHHRRP